MTAAEFVVTIKCEGREGTRINRWLGGLVLSQSTVLCSTSGRIVHELTRTPFRGRVSGQPLWETSWLRPCLNPCTRLVSSSKASKRLESIWRCIGYDGSRSMVRAPLTKFVMNLYTWSQQPVFTCRRHIWSLIFVRCY